MKRTAIVTAFALGTALAATACHRKPAADDNAAAATAQNAAAPPVVTASAPPAPAPVADFSIDSVPISNAPLGKFPYFGLPPGYAPQNTPKAPGFGHFLFWTGKAFKDVEGQTYMVTVVAAPDRQFSTYELKRNMEALFQQAGAVKIADARIPKPVLDAVPENVQMELLMGLGDVWNDPVETWVIHRPAETIWIHYTTNTAQASLAVVQAGAFVPTAALLPADTLKADLDRTGKAVIHVNFATDQAAILATSAPQMAAVVALLKADPSLKLAINGYTDDSGSDAHNTTLSDDRAKAVQSALAAAGIAPGRLQARGYGRLSPVSTNGDEAGKAANRRVELVKL